MTDTSDDADDLIWVQPSRIISCSVCHIADDVQTLSSKLHLKIRNYQDMKARNANLKKELVKQLEVCTIDVIMKYVFVIVSTLLHISPRYLLL